VEINTQSRLIVHRFRRVPQARRIEIPKKKMAADGASKIEINVWEMFLHL
jgi:hypothetical protein